MKDSHIEWTDNTFNPWIGCTKVSPGCDRCYAEFSASTRWKRVTGWGPKHARRRPSRQTLAAPHKWNRAAEKAGRRERVFCASWADVFDDHPSIKQEWRKSLWRTIRDTPALDWLLLTKRPENFERFLPPEWGDGYENVCLMVTAEDQKRVDSRIPILLETPARWRAISVEPMIDAVDLTKYIDAIDWVIVGGESLKGARPMNPNWVRCVRDLCEESNTRFLFKQWGFCHPDRVSEKVHRFPDGEKVHYRPRKGANGNLLDGRQHLEHPFND